MLPARPCFRSTSRQYAVNYVTGFRDGAVYRMYSRGANDVYTPDSYRSTHREVYCYAESKDGIRWTRPDLGLFEFNGSKKNKRDT